MPKPIPQSSTAHTTDRLVARSQQALEAVAPLLDRRRDQGLVRHCHGDLHLRNILVRDGHAVLFDAIEFDPAFAEIDVLYDLAFLVMDLEFRGLGRLGSVLLNRYLDNTGDAAGLPALPLFLSMRAAIRSHVDAAAAAAQSQKDAAAPLARMAARYLDLALGLSAARPAAPDRRRRLVRHPASRGWRANLRRVSAPLPARASCAPTRRASGWPE